MLKEFSWTNKYLFGIPEIDEQHQELVKRVNALVLDYRSPKGQQEILRVVDFLKAYVVYHFQSEEALMRQSGYPDLQDHTLLHEDYVTKVEALSLRLTDGLVTPDLITDCNALLVDWLSHHIDQEDRRFAEYLIRSRH